MKRLLSSPEGHTYQVICFALNTGMRLEEILSLEWENVDLANKKIKDISYSYEEQPESGDAYQRLFIRDNWNY